MINIFNDTLYAQRFLSSAGLYHGKLDGSYGPLTKAAEDAFEANYNAIKQSLGSFDLRSETCISSLLPKTQIVARKFLNIVKQFPLQVKIISGTRTYAEQNALYGQRPKVTNAKGGQSNHNFGLAFDVGIWKDGVYYTGKNSLENKAYVDLSKLIKSNIKALAWGGDWKSIIDRPHYELNVGKTVAQCRALLEAGKPYV